VTKEELEKLIREEENPKLDFKQEWYWNKNTPKQQKQKGQGEFVRDIIALANGHPDYVGKTAYLIIGIEDKSKKIYDFYKEAIKPFDKFKQEVFEIINNYAMPNIIDLDINWVYDTNNKVLVISIKPQEELIYLFKDLQVKNRTIDRGTTFFRIGENNKVASPNEIKKLQQAIENYKKEKISRQKAKKLKSLKLFEPKKEINEEEGIYINQKDTVKLFSLLPTVSNAEESRLSIECEITIILENSNKIIIDISEKETLENLFSGYKSIINEKRNNRNWIISFDGKSKLYTISLSSITLNVSHSTVELLGKFLDDLQINYAKRLNNIEEKLNSKEFPFSKEYKNGFELCQISPKLWNDIQKFYLKHLIDKGEGDWYIFGRYNEYNQIVVLDSPFSIDKIFKYKIKIENSSFSDVTNSTITIIWDTLSYHDLVKQNFSSVNESYNWFVKELIPQVIKESQKEKIKNRIYYFFNKKKALDLKLTEDDFHSLKFDKKDNNNLLIIEKLADFFYIKDIPISKNVLKDLYEGLILLFLESENLDYRYLSRKFFWIGEKPNIKKNYSDFKNKEKFILKIKKELIKIEENKIPIDNLINRYTIEHIFKCYNHIIQRNFDSYSDTFIYDIKEKLREIIEIYDILKVRERRVELYNNF